MRVEDLTVEVRNKALERLGQISAQYLNLPKCTARDSAVGEWALSIPADHALAEALRTPGAGIIVSLAGEVFLSGPMTKATTDSTFSDAAGVLTVEGVTDEIVLWDALAWPDPDLPIDEQGDYDLWLGDLSLDPLGALLAFLPNLDRLPVGSLGYGMTFGGLMAPAAAVIFFDDFNRADGDPANGWLGWEGSTISGIKDGTLAVWDDLGYGLYDIFYRPVDFTGLSQIRVSCTVAQDFVMGAVLELTIETATEYDYLADIYFDGGTVNLYGLGEVEYWTDDDLLLQAGDVIALEVSGSTVSASRNGALIASIPNASPVTAAANVQVHLQASGAVGESVSIDNFKIETF